MNDFNNVRSKAHGCCSLGLIYCMWNQTYEQKNMKRVATWMLKRCKNNSRTVNVLDFRSALSRHLGRLFASVGAMPAVRTVTVAYVDICSCSNISNGAN